MLFKFGVDVAKIGFKLTMLFKFGVDVAEIGFKLTSCFAATWTTNGYV